MFLCSHLVEFMVKLNCSELKFLREGRQANIIGDLSPSLNASSDWDKPFS